VPVQIVGAGVAGAGVVVTGVVAGVDTDGVGAVGVPKVGAAVVDEVEVCATAEELVRANVPHDMTKARYKVLT
jgi:hypothetical protein